jgi:hypothetical protein
VGPLAAVQAFLPGPLGLGDAALLGPSPLQLSALAAGSSDPQADVDALVNRLDHLREALLADGQARAGDLAGGTAMGLSLSVGYVVWLVRGGILASSMLAALPGWQMLDPLPMLGRLGTRQDDEDTGGDQVEDLFARSQGAPAPEAAGPQDTEETAR